MLALVLAVIFCNPDQFSAETIEKNKKALYAMESFEAEILVHIILIAAQHLLFIERHQVLKSYEALSALRFVESLLLLLAKEVITKFSEPLVDLLAILINRRPESQLLPKNIEMLRAKRNFVGALCIESDEFKSLRDLVAVGVAAMYYFCMRVALKVCST